MALVEGMVSALERFKILDNAPKLRHSDEASSSAKGAAYTSPGQGPGNNVKKTRALKARSNVV